MKKAILKDYVGELPEKRFWYYPAKVTAGPDLLPLGEKQEMADLKKKTLKSWRPNP